MNPAFVARRPALAPAATLAGAGAACLALAVADPRTGDSLWPVCPFHAITGLDCPGCGALRGIRSLLSGDVAAAAGYNVLLLVALPVLAAAWLAWASEAMGRPLPGRGRLPGWAVRAAPFVVGAWWVLRNLPWAPFSALGAT
jgi:hypothetical protein